MNYLMTLELEFIWISKINALVFPLIFISFHMTLVVLLYFLAASLLFDRIKSFRLTLLSFCLEIELVISLSNFN